jgi:thiamine monophosphate kinase
LSKDCRTLCYENSCGMVLHADPSQVPEEMVQLSDDLSQPWRDWFYHGGEDYELLFTASSGFDPLRYINADGGCRPVCIGECTAAPGELLFDDHGVRAALGARGYDHFGALLR